MEIYEIDTVRKRRRHLWVPVFPDEAQAIEDNAKRAGMSVACYLREVGQGYKIIGVVDYEHVRELARINGDLGRLGGLLNSGSPMTHAQRGSVMQRYSLCWRRLRKGKMSWARS